MPEPAVLPDQGDRERAWRTPGSLVVEASAGTGKTSLLIRRALWLLLEREVKIERIVALSFTEKAAADIAQRMREALKGACAAGAVDSLPETIRAVAPGRTLNRIQALAGVALAGFERSHLTTIHSFAGTLLRLYPVESRVDPDFRVVLDPERDEFLEGEWESFLGEMLGPASPSAAEWARVLATAGIGDLKDLAFELARFRVRLEDVPAGGGKGPLHPEIRAWLSAVRREAEELGEELGPRNRAPAAMLGAVGGAAEAVLESGRTALGKWAQVLREAPEVSGGWPKKWCRELCVRGREVNRAFRALKTAVAEGPALAALNLLAPFGRRAREALLRRGLMTFDGLISLARDLVRDHPPVREQLKRRFDAILVDEVQDVDPVQLELLLYLAETPGRAAKEWRDVRLAEGKLVLVGDPKQSIYGFRHADLKAYRAVMDLARKQNAVHVQLSTSMRSSEPIIAAVNAGGTTWFDGRANPAYLALKPNPGVGPGRRPVVLEFASEPGEDRGAAEARAIAAWIGARSPSGSERIPAGGRTVAVLVPQKRTGSGIADALRAAGIEVVAEDERGFYLRPEIEDVLNVLRLVADPADAVALAGVLRGPYGGLGDRELKDWFDRWHAGGGRADLDGFAAVTREAGFPGVVADAFTALGRLRRDLPHRPARMWVEELFAEFAAERLAGATGRPGAGAAVRALKEVAADLLRAHGIRRTAGLLAECVRQEGRNEEPPVPAPALGLPAAEIRAVRVMTIHQAKGLEFSTVILAGTHVEPRKARVTETSLRYDWSSGLAGVILQTKGSGEAIATIEGAYLRLAEQWRDEAQDLRVLYVALTRACEELVVTRMRGPDRAARGTGSLMSHLMPVLEGWPDLFEVEEGAQARVLPSPVPPESGADPGDAAGPVPEARPPSPRPLGTPSDLAERFPGDPDEPAPPGRSASQWVGELCHRVLEKWDYSAGRESVRDAVARALAAIPGPDPVPEEVVRRAREVLAEYVGSEAARELRGASILGREVPLAAEIDGGTIVARADLVFRSASGRLTVGDYKLAEAPAVSAGAAAAYRRVAAAACGEPADFVLISLTAGTITAV